MKFKVGDTVIHRHKGCLNDQASGVIIKIAPRALDGNVIWHTIELDNNSIGKSKNYSQNEISLLLPRKYKLK